MTHLHLLELLHKAGTGNPIPVSAVAAEDDFDAVEDDEDEDAGEGDDWLNVGDLDDLAERTKTNPAAPFQPAMLKALAKLQPHELQAKFEELKAAGVQKDYSANAGLCGRRLRRRRRRKRRPP